MAWETDQTPYVTHRYSLVLEDESRHIEQRTNANAKAMLQDTKRTLVAILAGDVAGYRRLAGQDEEQTAQNWAASRDYIHDVAGDYQGRPIETAGDGLAFAFASVLDALRCAVEVQQFLRDVNTGVPAERQLQLRFGLHLDGVPVNGAAVPGDRTDVAFGLERLADPGGICVSEAVYRNVAAGSEFAFEELGEAGLGDGAVPLPAYRVTLSDAGPVPAARLSDSAADTRPAVAVLPFENRLGHAKDELLVDGIAEDVIAALAAFRGFPVIAQGSTFAYKGKSPDARAVARDLGARYVLGGSVHADGAHITVCAELVDAATDDRCWRERFDRRAHDILTLPEEIARRVVGTIAPHSAVDPARAEQARPKDLTAWALCRRGRALLDAFTPEGNRRAREQFEKAIARDPGYAPAHAGLAYSLHRDLWFEVADSRDGTIDELLAAARHAVSLDETSSDAHCVLCFGLIWDRQFKLAIAAGERAVELNPSNAIAFSGLGMAQSFAGRPVDGIANLERSIKLNPQDPRIHFVITMLARAHLNARTPEPAVRWAETAVRRRVDYPLAHLVLAAAFGHIGRAGEAHSALAECERLDPGFATRWALRPMYRDPADDLYFLDGLRRAGLDTEAEPV